MKKERKSKRQRTRWILTHKYENGFVRGGIVNNTKLGLPYDVIAFEDWGISPDGSEYNSLRHMSVDEALVVIDCLIRPILFYMEKFKVINDKKLMEIYYAKERRIPKTRSKNTN